MAMQAGICNRLVCVKAADVLPGITELAGLPLAEGDTLTIDITDGRVWYINKAPEEGEIPRMWDLKERRISIYDAMMDAEAVECDDTVLECNS